MYFSDKRVENWFLMQGYTPTLLITVVYVLFVTKIGPKFMENREPYRLKWPIVIYNFICIAINFHICSQVRGGCELKHVLHLQIKPLYSWNLKLEYL